MKNIDLEMAKTELDAGEYTCELVLGESIYTSTFRGVRPLVSWYESGLELCEYSAADKVVGRATAFLYVMLGVKAVYARVMSRGALEVLQKNGIYAEYGTLADNIINRKGDGICPFEAAVLEINDTDAAYEAIRAKMREMNISI